MAGAAGITGDAQAQVIGLEGARLSVLSPARYAERFGEMALALGHRSSMFGAITLATGDLAAACPDGIDVYFENVGGKTFAAVLEHLNKNSRISRCGLISQYGNMDGRDPSEVWLEIGQGVFDKQSCGVFPLAVGNFVAEHQDAFLGQMADWLKDGKVKYLEDIRQGLENTPSVFREMLEGGNFGKTMIQVSADPTK